MEAEAYTLRCDASAEPSSAQTLDASQPVEHALHQDCEKDHVALAPISTVLQTEGLQ